MYDLLYQIFFGLDVLLAGLTFGLVGSVVVGYAKSLPVDKSRLRSRHIHVLLVGSGFIWLLGWSIVSLVLTARTPGSDFTVFAYPPGFMIFIAGLWYLYKSRNWYASR